MAPPPARNHTALMLHLGWIDERTRMLSVAARCAFLAAALLTGACSPETGAVVDVDTTAGAGVIDGLTATVANCPAAPCTDPADETPLALVSEGGAISFPNRFVLDLRNPVAGSLRVCVFGRSAGSIVASDCDEGALVIGAVTPLSVTLETSCCIGDAGTESGAPDSGPSDSALDTGTDSGIDAASDASSDMAIDSGTDVGTDAGSDSGSDAGTDSGVTVCDWNAPGWSFGPAVPLAILNSPDTEADPFITADGLTMYFVSNRPGGLGSFDVYRSTRTTVSSPWTAPVVDTDLSSSTFDGKASISTDGLSAYVSTNRVGGVGSIDTWVFTRATTLLPFGSGALVANVNTTDTDNNAEISLTGLELWFTNNGTLAPLGSHDIVVATRATTADPFSAPVTVLEVSSAALDADPNMSTDELLLVFASERAGGAGMLDIYYAMRPSAAMPFGMPLPVPGLNSADQENDPFVTPDGCEIYFARTTPATPGDIFMATYTP